MTRPAQHPSQTWHDAMRRQAAFTAALYEAKGQLYAATTPYGRLRERYATGRITLEQFEAEVTGLLQDAA